MTETITTFSTECPECGAVVKLLILDAEETEFELHCGCGYSTTLVRESDDAASAS